MKNDWKYVVRDCTLAGCEYIDAVSFAHRDLGVHYTHKSKALPHESWALDLSDDETNSGDKLFPQTR